MLIFERVVTPAARGTACKAALFVSAALLSLAQAGMVHAQGRATGASQQMVAIDIAAQPLDSALTALADQAGLRILFSSNDVAGIRVPALKGRFAPAEALGRMLAGTGFAYRETGPRAFTLEPAPQAADGSIQLGALRIEGRDGGAGSGGSAGEGATADSIYRNPGAVSHVDGAVIEQYRGQSPADMLRGIPGVMSGEARNGAGSLDINIRGMQGMGRVAVTVDGTMNATNIYQGYQGISNRSFVDPDLLASIDVKRGPDAGSSGIAGTVEMRTIGAKDIVSEGREFGLKIRGSLVSNRSEPMPFATPAGYVIGTNGYTETVMNRPRQSLFKPADGSASVAAAYSGAIFDLVGAYAWRKQGNYHAGEHGPVVNPVNIGPRTVCSFPGTPYEMCRVYNPYYVNKGITNLRGGEMVPNTSFETQSWLAKASARFGDGHDVQLGYTHFRSENGAKMASVQATLTSRPSQGRFEGARSDNVSLRYGWNPEGNDLIDVKANMWLTDMELRHPRRASHSLKYTFPADHPVNNLPVDFRSGTDNQMWGFDVTNKMILGDVEAVAGVSWLSEDTRPSYLTREMEGQYAPRDGKRGEWAIFAKSEWQATDWFQLNGALRWQRFSTVDRSDWKAAGVADSLLIFYEPGTRTHGSSFSPSVGAVFIPFEDGQIYLNYAHAKRHPSLMESASAFSLLSVRPVGPETARNFEAGINVQQSGLLGTTDRAAVKLGYFRSDIENYIARQFYLPDDPDDTNYYGMMIYNTHGALFEGLELSARYQSGGFTADLALNHYLRVEFCKTATSCSAESLYADYATNQVPPKTTIDVSLSQKLLNQALELGTRASYRSDRAISHGVADAAGAALFIEQIGWKSYMLVDLFMKYQLSSWASVDVQVQNLTDRFYIDPLSLITQPGPGRTMTAALTLKF